MKTVSGTDLSWLGIGTYGIGGRGHRDMPLTELQEDKKYLDALGYQFEIGMNFTEIALGYGHGNACRLFAQAMSRTGIKREDLFITHALYTRDFDGFTDVHSDIDSMYDIFQTTYFDSTLVTQCLCKRFGYDIIVETLKELLSSGKTRYISLSNASKSFILQFKREFGDKMFAHETHLSFEARTNQDAGIFDICSENAIENIIRRPLRRNLSSRRNRGVLDQLTEKYHKTHNQIILNRIYSLGLKPMVMSASKAHIQENRDANGFNMEQSDIDLLTGFRIPGIIESSIDRDQTGDGIAMDSYVIGLDKDIDDLLE